MAQATAPILDSTKCEVRTALSNVRVRGQSGRHLLGLSISHFDPQRTSVMAENEMRFGRLCVVYRNALRLRHPLFAGKQS